MEERLQKALEFANYRQTLNNQLQKIKVRAEGMLIFAKNGGSFTINRELICFLDYLDKQGINDVALLDDNNLPVQIDNVKGFLADITKRYFEVTSDYLKEYQEVRKARNVKTIVDFKE
jgi:predicted HTH transcriptional regulator